jgi:16S rRNA processing protein RimM
MSTTPLVCLGKITAPHGVRGWVKVECYTQNPADLLTYALTDASGQTAYELERQGRYKGGLLCSVAGITDRTAAEALRNIQLYAPRAALPPVADDEVYYADLIGLTARLPDGSILGEIMAVENYGGGDLLTIRRPGHGPTLLYPFNAITVPHIDVAAGYASLNPPEGLLPEELLEESQ